MQQYLGLLADILQNGNSRPDRTNTGTVSAFGRMARFDLSKGQFPLVTTKQVFLRGIIEELLWILRGSTDNLELALKNVKIWNEWAPDSGAIVEYTRDQRIELLMETSHSDGLKSSVRDLVKVLEQSAEAPQEHKDAIIKDIDECLDFAGMPKHKAQPLGPIYGEQWRKWPKITMANQHETLPVLERLQRLSFEQIIGNQNTLNDLYLRLMRPIDKQDYADVEKELHEVLDGLNVPRSMTMTFPEVVYIDQMQELLDGLRKKPYSRRHIVSAWNPAVLPDESISPQANAELGNACLASCHAFFQMYVRDRSMEDIKADAGGIVWMELEAYQATLDVSDYGSVISPKFTELSFRWLNERGVKTHYLDCLLYQRSADMMLGVPFNIASYALLNMMVAQVVGMLPGEFIHVFGDAHVYGNHLEGAELQLTRTPHPLPKMTLNPEVTDLFAFKLEDFVLTDYEHDEAIKFAVAI